MTYSPNIVVWQIHKLIAIAYKKYLLFAIDTITKSSLFRMKYDIGCLFDDSCI